MNSPPSSSGTQAQLNQLLSTHYNWTATACKALAGEADLNFYISNAAGDAFTLKLSAPDTPPEAIEFQAAIMKHLAKQSLPFSIPEVVQTRSGEDFVRVKWEGEWRQLRLQSWVSGRMLGDLNYRSPGLLTDWGATAGALTKALADFDHPYAHRSYRWNPSETLAAQPDHCYFANQQQIEIAQYFWTYFETCTQPKLSGLRKSVNYNDAHEHNLLIGGPDLYAPQITGVIDFGDALYTETINELAIACAYAGMHAADPLGAMTQVVAGYHQVFPLKDTEVEVLFSLITGRLLITVTSAARSRQEQPDNEYLSISEQPAWALLQQLAELSPQLVHFTFRHACGWAPVSNRADFDHWAYDNRTSFHPVIPLEKNDIVQLDCSVGSLDLGNTSNYLSIDGFSATINRMIVEKGGGIGVGGYAEVRPFYTTDAFQSEGNQGPRWRSVHLGYDIWTKADTTVFAPLDGRIHGFHYDPAPGSYGATILLEHDAPFGCFYTLYGHLSKASLDGLTIGQSVSGGSSIATLGQASENGGWPPHLHFQVMLDALGETNDFPGAAYPESAEIWLNICPDPRILMPSELAGRLDYSSSNPAYATQLSNEAARIQTIRRQHIGRSLSLSYQQPLHIQRGYLQHLYDSSGRRYLDTVNNVAHVGHEHPEVVAAAQRQVAVLNTNTRYLHEQLTAFAEELLATFPAELNVVHFVNSGSEANELALRMAEAHAGTRNVVAVEMGYHGNTGRTIDVSSYKFDRKGGKGAPSTTAIVPRPDVYRGLHRGPEGSGERYARYVKEACESFQKRGERVGAFLCESILSCGGQVELPVDYLRKSYAHVRAAGGICIADEVQVGVGRIGTHWWAFEPQGVVPDIVTIGKPLGNGHPLGAVVCTSEVAKNFANGMEYFNTFGGNPVSCAIGRSVLGVVKHAELRKNAIRQEAFLKAGLRKLQEQFPVIGDIRGRGLFLGVELVEDPKTKVPATALANHIKQQMRQFGILMSTDGPDDNVLKIKPPMCFTEQDGARLLTYLGRVLTAVF